MLYHCWSVLLLCTSGSHYCCVVLSMEICGWYLEAVNMIVTSGQLWRHERLSQSMYRTWLCRCSYGLKQANTATISFIWPECCKPPCKCGADRVAGEETHHVAVRLCCGCNFLHFVRFIVFMTDHHCMLTACDTQVGGMLFDSVVGRTSVSRLFTGHRHHQATTGHCTGRLCSIFARSFLFFVDSFTTFVVPSPVVCVSDCLLLWLRLGL